MEISGDLKDIGYVLALLFALVLVLVILQKPISEGFQGEVMMCGVGKAPCAGHLKCVNGYCANTEPKAAYESNPVPLLPGGQPLPLPFF
jgi:hypothetical protein